MLLVWDDRTTSLATCASQMLRGWRGCGVVEVEEDMLAKGSQM
jgi:hypothetical protein